MEWERSKIVNTNGQKYRIGWDEHGYFSIQSGELDGEGEFVPYEDQHLVSFSPTGATHLMHLLEDGPP